MPIPSWSTTAADNDDSDLANGINWREGMRPAQVKFSARAMMAEIRKGFEFSNTSTTGSIVLPIGRLMQWGRATYSGGIGTIDFSVIFTSTPSVSLTGIGFTGFLTPTLITATPTTIVYKLKKRDPAGAIEDAVGFEIYWSAIGSGP